jgi:hypothetical protein
MAPRGERAILLAAADDSADTRLGASSEAGCGAMWCDAVVRCPSQPATAVELEPLPSVARCGASCQALGFRCPRHPESPSSATGDDRVRGGARTVSLTSPEIVRGHPICRSGADWPTLHPSSLGECPRLAVHPITSHPGASQAHSEWVSLARPSGVAVEGSLGWLVAGLSDARGCRGSGGDLRPPNHTPEECSCKARWHPHRRQKHWGASGVQATQPACRPATPRGHMWCRAGEAESGAGCAARVARQASTMW